MTTQAAKPKGRQRHVGKVLTQLTIRNRADEVLVAAGHLLPEEVRELTLDDVLVDTGATTLCLPADMIRHLGLARLQDVPVETAAGVATYGLFRDATLTVEGRTGTFECIETPEGTQPLLGVIPLEMLGLELDLQNQQLRSLPATGRQTFYLAVSPRIRY